MLIVSFEIYYDSCITSQILMHLTVQYTVYILYKQLLYVQMASQLQEMQIIEKSTFSFGMRTFSVSVIDACFVIYNTEDVQRKDSLLHVKYKPAVWELIESSHDVKSPCSYFISEIKRGIWGDLVCDAREDHYKAVSKMGLWKNPIETYTGNR